MIKQSESELKDSSADGQAMPAFVFPNEYTRAVYESLRQYCAAEIKQLIAKATAEAKSDVGSGENNEKLMWILGENICDWLVDKNPLWISDLDIADAYRELAILALEEVDFTIVGKAFLDGVETHTD